jgi:hypothetical protein
MNKNKIPQTAISFLFSLSILSSCKNIKAFSEQKIDYKSSKESFVIKNGQMLITTKINQKVDTLIFDTGASSTTIFNENIINEGGFISNFKIGAKLPDNSKIYLQEKKYTIENNLIYSDNIVLKTLNIPKRACSNSQMKDIFGNNVFRRDEKIINLDFEKSNISILDFDESNKLIKDNNYFEIPIKIKSGIYFIIKDGKYKGEYLIDTGNSGASLISNNNKLISKESSETFEGALFFDASGKTKSNIKTYINTINDFPILENIKMNIVYFDKFKGNNLGLDFIKRFNWIIDFKNKKAYLKLINSKDSDKLIFPFTYLCNVENGKFIICTKNASKSLFNIGDEIISIGNEKISSENICEKMKLLNQSKKWEDLNLVINKPEVK